MTTTPKVAPYVPILLNFNYADTPVGYVDLQNENCILKVNTARQRITADELNAGTVVFAPSYVITKIDDKGYIQEITVDSFSLITAPPK